MLSYNYYAYIIHSVTAIIIIINLRAMNKRAREENVPIRVLHPSGRTVTVFRSGASAFITGQGGGTTNHPTPEITGKRRGHERTQNVCKKIHAHTRTHTYYYVHRLTYIVTGYRVIVHQFSNSVRIRQPSVSCNVPFFLSPAT